jgi:hypothetical protein
VWRDLERIARVDQPLVIIEGHTDSRIHKASFSITETGIEVLEGRADFVDLNGIDQWLGGVRLNKDSLWRWDEQKQELNRIA